MVKKCVRMTSLVVVMIAGSALAALNPVGTVWNPATASTGANGASLPIIDSVTGNPVQAMYAVGSNLNRINDGAYGTGGHFQDLEITETHNFANYSGSLMNTKSAGSFWKHSTKELWDSPQYDMDQKARLVSSVYQMWSGVWAFVAPQDGQYHLSGNMFVKKYNGIVPNPVHVFTFTGPGKTNTDLAAFDTLSAEAQTGISYSIPSQILSLQTGDMICIAAFGGNNGTGDSGWTNFGAQRAEVDLNNTATNSLVSITLVPEPCTMMLMGLGLLGGGLKIRRKM